jgi:hypothetical protein
VQIVDAYQKNVSKANEQKNVQIALEMNVSV